jgi:hypothetical protein
MVAIVSHVHEDGRRRRLAGERADCGHGYVTTQGFAFQIPAAYSAIVRSLENLPDAATLRIAFRAQPSRSA